MTLLRVQAYKGVPSTGLLQIAFLVSMLNLAIDFFVPKKTSFGELMVIPFLY